MGDSQNLIRLLVKNLPSKDMNLNRIVFRIKKLSQSFTMLEYFHVLRANNAEADREANRVVRLGQGVLSIGEVDEKDPIP